MKRFLRIMTVLFVLVAILNSCAASMNATLPDPKGVKITLPPAGLAAELAAFSGTWEGMWGGMLPSRLIVETINAKSAQVVYVVGDHPYGAFKGSWVRVKANVLPGGRLQWGKPSALFTFQMSKDRMSIKGEFDKDGSEVAMKKVGP